MASTKGEEGGGGGGERWVRKGLKRTESAVNGAWRK